MTGKKTKKILKESVTLKKSLGELMKDEDGFVSKENILKVGLSTVAALGVVGALTETQAQVVHTNAVVPDPGQPCANHTNHSSHTSY
jgi:hypothetical protein